MAGAPILSNLKEMDMRRDTFLKSLAALAAAGALPSAAWASSSTPARATRTR